MTKIFYKTILILLLFTSPALAACTGSSPNWTAATWADVQTCHNNATSGDTITVTSASGTISSQTLFTKGITLIGPTCTVDGNLRTTGCPGVLHNANATYLLGITLEANKLTRISNFEFVADASSSSGGIVQIVGANTDNRRIRFDHCAMTANVSGAVTFFIYQAYGVIDHCTFTTSQPAGLAETNGRIGAGEIPGGSANWAGGLQAGTEHFLFFEDNNITRTGAGVTIIDGHHGSRYVVRYNTVTDGTMEGHGNEGADERGTMAAEVYNNLWTMNVNTFIGYHRSGTQTWHDNAIYSPSGAPTMNLLNPRLVDPNCCYGMADGRSQWDVNDAGSPFAIGTCTSVGSLTCTVAGNPYSGSQYVGYQIRRTPGNTVKTCTSITRTSTTGTATCSSHGFSNGNTVSLFGTGLETAALSGWMQVYTISNVSANTFDFTVANGAESIGNVSTGQILAVKDSIWSSEIVSNTTNTITFRAALFTGLVFSANDNFEINKVTQVLDGIGRTGGSLVTGSPSTPPGGWNDETTAISYQWNNFRCTSNPPTAGCSHSETAKFAPNFVQGMNYSDDTSRPGYTSFTYPHPLVTCGQVSCSGVGPIRFKTRKH